MNFITGWNLHLIIPLLGSLYLINRGIPKCSIHPNVQDKVNVINHTRSYPKRDHSEKEIRFKQFEKNHTRGLKGNNTTQFAREKRIKKLTKMMDNYAEKSFHYSRIGNKKKALYYGNKTRQLDDEINSVAV